MAQLATFVLGVGIDKSSKLLLHITAIDLRLTGLPTKSEFLMNMAPCKSMDAILNLAFDARKLLRCAYTDEACILRSIKYKRANIGTHLISNYLNVAQLHVCTFRIDCATLHKSAYADCKHLMRMMTFVATLSIKVVLTITKFPPFINIAPPESA